MRRGAETIRLRPLGVRDRDGLATLFRRMSANSRYSRFLSPKPTLTDRELAYLTDIDHVNHEAIAAVDSRDGSIVGVARYVRLRVPPNVAEVSLEVADELHGLGIGTALATSIVQRARANGVTVLSASTLWENRSARAVMRRFGFRAIASSGSVVEFKLGLQAAPEQTVRLPAL